MAGDTLPGSPGGLDGPGMNWAEVIRHPHDIDPGRMVSMDCPQTACGYSGGPWVLGCARCMQLACADYAAHMAAGHTGSLLERIDQLRGTR